MPAYFRQHVPLGTGGAYTELNGGGEHVMIAILLQGRYRDQLTYHPGNIRRDLGMTMHKIYQQFTVAQSNKYAMELGG
eukprot:4202643-Pyramimonas_sp.AAC.1